MEDVDMFTALEHVPVSLICSETPAAPNQGAAASLPPTVAHLGFVGTAWPAPHLPPPSPPVSSSPAPAAVRPDGREASGNGQQRQEAAEPAAERGNGAAASAPPYVESSVPAQPAAGHGQPPPRQHLATDAGPQPSPGAALLASAAAAFTAHKSVSCRELNTEPAPPAAADATEHRKPAQQHVSQPSNFNPPAQSAHAAARAAQHSQQQQQQQRAEAQLLTPAVDGAPAAAVPAPAAAPARKPPVRRQPSTKQNPTPCRKPAANKPAAQKAAAREVPAQATAPSAAGGEDNAEAEAEVEAPVPPRRMQRRRLQCMTLDFSSDDGESGASSCSKAEPDLGAAGGGSSYEEDVSVDKAPRQRKPRASARIKRTDGAAGKPAADPRGPRCSYSVQRWLKPPIHHCTRPD